MRRPPRLSHHTCIFPAAETRQDSVHRRSTFYFVFAPSHTRPHLRNHPGKVPARFGTFLLTLDQLSPHPSRSRRPIIAHSIRKEARFPPPSVPRAGPSDIDLLACLASGVARSARRATTIYKQRTARLSALLATPRLLLVNWNRRQIQGLTGHDAVHRSQPLVHVSM